MFLRRKWVTALVSIVIVLLSAFSVCSGIYIAQLTDKYKQEQQTSTERAEENKTLQAQTNSLQLEINQLEQDKIDLREQQIILEEEKADLLEEKNALASQKAQLENSIEQLDAEIEKLEDDNATLEDDLQNLQNQKQTLQGQLDEVTVKFDNLQIDYEALEKQKGDLQQEYDQVSKDLQDAKSELEYLRSKLGSTTATVPGDVNRLVLMIGDSMSSDHIKETETRIEDKLYMSKFKYSGSVALAEGENAEDTYKQIVATAKTKGLGLAFVTTDILYQDTAYRFTAQGAADSTFANVLAAQCASEFDLIFGADYYDAGTTTYTYASNKTQLQNAGFKFIDNLNYSTVTSLDGEKMFGAFQTISSSEYTAMQDNSKTNVKPCLGQMTDYAVKFMENKFPNGYILIVENNQIAEQTEEFLSNDNSAPMVERLVELDRTARIIRQTYQEKEVDYSIVVTADEDATSKVPFYIDSLGCDLGNETTTAQMLSFMADNVKMENGKVEKVVMMIGDGMGVNHIAMAQNFLDDGEKLNMTEFEYSGQLDTNSLSTLSGGTPDSAAGGSALATGQRVINGYISMDPEGNNIENLSEKFKARGMGVGVISTDYLFEATPAAFSAHTNSRYNFVDIRSQQYAGNIDLFLGGDMYSEKLLADANGFYTEDSTNGTTAGYIYNLEQQKIKDAGFTYITDMGAGKVDLDCARLFGAFPSISASKTKAPLDSDTTNTAPSLTQMVELAINWMERHYGDKGYFLMIEENNIDVFSEQHSDGGKILSYDTGDVVEAIFELDRAAGKVKEMFDATGDNYAIAISADHATGSLTKSSSRQNYGFWSSWHDTQNVPYFIEVKGAAEVDFDWFGNATRRSSLDGGKLSVDYCDCNIFASLYEKGGDATLLTKHNYGNLFGSGKFETLDQKYTSLMSNYIVSDSFTAWNASANLTQLKAYMDFVEATNGVWDSSLNGVAKNRTYDFSTGAIVGLNKLFTVDLGNTSSLTYDNLQTVAAKLFGFGDVDVFKEYAQKVAQLSSSNLQNNGAVYTSNKNKLHILPFTFETSQTDVIYSFVIIDKTGTISIWISDVEAACEAVDFAGALTDGEVATIKIAGKQKHFVAPDNTKVVDFINSLDIVNPNEATA